VKHAQGARSLFLSPASILYIGTRDEGDGNGMNLFFVTVCVDIYFFYLFIDKISFFFQ